MHLIKSERKKVRVLVHASIIIYVLFIIFKNIPVKTSFLIDNNL